MFQSDLYSKRRAALKSKVSSGIVLLPGNTDASYNYPANTYHFRQDSNFLYFFGLNISGLFGVIDLDADKDYIFGNDFDIDDIIWMGPQPSVKDLAAKAGVGNTDTLKTLQSLVANAVKKGQKVHIVPQYRARTVNQLADLLDVTHREIPGCVSEELIKGIVSLRSFKDEYEVVEIEKAIDTAYNSSIT